MKAKLEADREVLVEEKEALEADKASLAEQQSYLNGILAQKKAISANYDAEIAEAKSRAAQFKQQIAADTKSQRGKYHSGGAGDRGAVERQRQRKVHCKLCLSVYRKSLCVRRHQPDKRGGLLRFHLPAVCGLRIPGPPDIFPASERRHRCFLFGGTAR